MTPEEPTVRISVIISTRNRADQLRSCLEALASQRNVTREACEVIVVDNGSTDHTEQTVRTVQQRFGQIEYLYEETLGLSVARRQLRSACQAGVARMFARRWSMDFWMKICGWSKDALMD